MRIAYLDCFAGIAGDMFVAAAVDAGVPFPIIEQAVASLDLGVTLQMEKVDRSGISSAKFHVQIDGKSAEAAEHVHTHENGHTHTHEHGHERDHAHNHASDHAHKLDEHHDHPHSHEHNEYPHAHEHGEHEQKHAHVHGRSLEQIRALLRAAPLASSVRERAARIFELLGAAEAKIHNVPVDSIHFHEVGSVDAIVDIVAASAAIEHLEQAGPLTWHTSAINVGGGMVQCAHGTFPVPAPATAELLRDLPTYSAHIQQELVTPTGAAILRALAPQAAAPPPTAYSRIGYGAGSRNPKRFPNVLRLSLGDSAEDTEEGIVVLEAALDDQNPQMIAHAAQCALAEGALDVMLTSVLMKKGRPGTLVTLLARPADAARMEALLFRETTTLGLRTRRETRRVLERRHVPMETRYGVISIKLGLLRGEVVNAAPEFEDCRRAAQTHNASLKAVYQAAIAAWQSSVASSLEHS